MVAVWAKVYAMEVKVEVAWADEVFVKNLTLSTIHRFVLRPVQLPRLFLKEVLSMGYIYDPLSPDF